LQDCCSIALLDIIQIAKKLVANDSVASRRVPAQRL